jgi:hypothetical protein
LSGVAAPAPLSLRAVEVAERYAEGTATKEELTKAIRDAYDAAYADVDVDAADYAAYYAAGAAAYYAAAAAADVDDAVARNAERETQLADLVEVLSK